MVFALWQTLFTNLTCANLISQAIFSWGMVTAIATWSKVVSYRDRRFENDFIILVVEIFGCLH